MRLISYDHFSQLLRVLARQKWSNDLKGKCHAYKTYERSENTWKPLQKTIKNKGNPISMLFQRSLKNNWRPHHLFWTSSHLKLAFLPFEEPALVSPSRSDEAHFGPRCRSSFTWAPLLSCISCRAGSLSASFKQTQQRHQLRGIFLALKWRTHT